MTKIKRRTLIVEWMIAFVGNINKHNKIVTKEKLMAETCLFFGCGERLVREILNHLQISGKFIIEYGEIWTKEAYEHQKIVEKGVYDGVTTTVPP